MKNIESKVEKISQALRSFGHRTFEVHGGCNAKYHAQRELKGRTHYVDDDTLHYFRSRILHAFGLDDGLLFVVIERVGSKPEDIPGGKIRVVLFDVFGTVVEREGTRDNWHSTVGAAEKFLRTARATWLTREFQIRHTQEQMRQRAKRLRWEAQALSNAAR